MIAARPRLDLLRWPLLLLAAAFLLRGLLSGATPLNVTGATVCFVGWYALSRRKALSLDRREQPFTPGLPGA